MFTVDCYGALITNTLTGASRTVWFILKDGRDALALDLSVEDVLNSVTVKKLRRRTIRDGVDTPHIFFSYRDFILHDNVLPE